eukprot:Rhum_TRINITY_DN14915_c2_g1::Rhum_TRINITY_DN14915_c2_g1_i2::g.127274::m.127274
MRAVIAFLLLALGADANTVKLAVDNLGAIRNPQCGWAAQYNKHNDGYWADGFWFPEKCWAKDDESVELVAVEWNRVMTGPNEFNIDLLKKILGNMQRRGRQAIVRLYAHEWRDVNHTAVRTLPAHMYEPAFGLKFCRDLNRRGDFFVPDWEHEGLLLAVEATINAMRVLNGDNRVLAFEVGFVGYDGQWEHSKDQDCPLPSPHSANRIIHAALAAWPNSFVLMPNPWEAPTFPYAEYPRLGLVDPNFGNTHWLPKVAALGLQDRWKTAPVLAMLRDVVERCWFQNDDGALACLNRGVRSNMPQYIDAVSQAHVAVVGHEKIFKNTVGNGLLWARIKNGYKRTGAYLHLTEVSTQIKAEKLSVCVRIKNVGSSPFYSPPGKPLRPVVTIKGIAHELLNDAKPLSQLYPGESVPYSAAPIPWPKTVDECAGNTVCSAVDQWCIDRNKSPERLGDWVCRCKGFAQEETGRAAVCKTITFQRYNEKWYDPRSNVQIGRASAFNMVDHSFTVATKAKFATCPTKGCTQEHVAWVWDIQAILGAFPDLDDVKKPYYGYSMRYYGRGIQIEHLQWRCYWNKAQVPVNTWVHLANVYDFQALTTSIYVDGILRLRCPLGPLKDSDLAIGKEFDPANPSNRGGRWHFKGSLKEFRIYDSVLTKGDLDRLVVPTPLRQSGELPARVSIDTLFRVPTRGIKFASKAVSGDVSFDDNGGATVIVPTTETLDAPDSCLAPDPLKDPPPVFNAETCGVARLIGYDQMCASALAPSGSEDVYCDGVYTKRKDKDGKTYWTKIYEPDDQLKLRPRHLHGRSDGGCRCSFAADDADGSLVVGDDLPADFWAWHFTCIAPATQAPPTAPPVVAPETPTPPVLMSPAGTVPPYAWSKTVSPPVVTPIPHTAVPDTPSPPYLPPDEVTASPLVVPFTASPMAATPTQTPQPTSASAPTSPSPCQGTFMGASHEFVQTTTFKRNAGEFVFTAAIGGLFVANLAVWAGVYSKKKKGIAGRIGSFSLRRGHKDVYDGGYAGHEMIAVPSAALQSPLGAAASPTASGVYHQAGSPLVLASPVLGGGGGGFPAESSQLSPSGRVRTSLPQIDTQFVPPLSASPRGAGSPQHGRGKRKDSAGAVVPPRRSSKDSKRLDADTALAAKGSCFSNVSAVSAGELKLDELKHDSPSSPVRDTQGSIPFDGKAKGSVDDNTDSSPSHEGGDDV